jgi:hypothetical protein
MRVRLLGSRLDSRIAAGEDPVRDPALEYRCAQLVSTRARQGIARGLLRACSQRPGTAALSAAVPCDWRAVQIARPAVQQLAAALRSREVVQPQGVAISKVLLTEPCSALYRPAYPSELYEVAREALFALLPHAASQATPEEHHERHRTQA